MALISYSSLPKIDEKSHQAGPFKFQNCANQGSVKSQCLRIAGMENFYPTLSQPDFPEDFVSGEYIFSNSEVVPEVNLKTVLTGLAAMITGRNRTPNTAHQKSSSDASFLQPDKNCDGDIHIHPSVCIPSAPPLVESEALKCTEYTEILQAEPPEWLPDSYATACMQCHLPFTALIRGRHHCRFCGAIFCNSCSKGRCLLPNKFRERNPQRVCDTCFDRLDPLQGILINYISNAAQTAKHDVMDWTTARAWLNWPLGFSMEYEIYKATKTLTNYCQVAWLSPEASIPSAVLTGAKGLAIMTVAKAGAFLTYKVGTGIVVSRRSDGSWSAPSAMYSIGLGWGPQVGGELLDFIIVLHGHKAVKAFSSRLHVSLGAGVSAAAGPIGRVLEADLLAGDQGSGICYTYSCSKGAFVGVSLEGNIVGTRAEANLRFYGDPYLTANDILFGHVERPRAAQPLYRALEELCSQVGSH